MALTEREFNWRAQSRAQERCEAWELDNAIETSPAREAKTLRQCSVGSSKNNPSNPLRSLPIRLIRPKLLPRQERSHTAPHAPLIGPQLLPCLSARSRPHTPREREAASDAYLVAWRPSRPPSTLTLHSHTPVDPHVDDSRCPGVGCLGTNPYHDADSDAHIAPLLDAVLSPLSFPARTRAPATGTNLVLTTKVTTKVTTAHGCVIGGTASITPQT